MITSEEIRLARESLGFTMEAGADAVRITLTKSTEDIVATLDGAVDRVTRCADRSMNIALFADGRFGTFSINKLDEATLKDFILKAIETVRMLAPDGFRKLPEAARCCKTAVNGKEMGIYDDAWSGITPDDRLRMALDAAVTCHPEQPLCHPEHPLCHPERPICHPERPICHPERSEGPRLISEEGEYSDSEYDTYVIDSQGLECRHCETSFDYGVEVTVQDSKGAKYSDYWWTASPFLKDFDASSCGRIACERAFGQVGAKPARSGKYRMVVSTEAASKLVTPLLNALNAYSIQQGNSFLAGTLGQKLFCDGLSILDEPGRVGESGSKLFDGEGVACFDEPVIEGGVIKRYSVNSYMAGKMQIDPTVEDVIRARVAPWPYPGLDRDKLMGICGNGILVTDFNGGNCNMTTGDFSYGISGQLFKNGKCVRPVNEMLITGNFLQLWKNLLAAGDDYRKCSTRLVPSLAFEGVDFSG